MKPKLRTGRKVFYSKVMGLYTTQFDIFHHYAWRRIYRTKTGFCFQDGKGRTIRFKQLSELTY